MKSVRIALCQIDAVVGDVAANRDRVLSVLREASAAEAQIAIFPELVLSGYPPEDLVGSPAFVREVMAALAVIAEATTETVAVVGFVESSDFALYNAAGILAHGEVQGVWRKELLPNYGVFDERRWFTPGDGKTPLFQIGEARVGVCICEDAWSATGPLVRQGLAGAQLIVCINASPYRVGVIEERETMLAERARSCDAAIAYVNLVGAQDELVFDGSSMVFDAQGTLIANASQFEDQMVVVDIPVSEKVLPAESTEPLVIAEFTAESEKILPPVRKMWLAELDEVYAALVHATRGYVKKNGFSDVVIGLSGGIDSSLVAAIAVEALGARHVHGVAMPSRFSSSQSEDDASVLADHLGIDFRVIPIESVHRSFLDLLAPHFSNRPPGLAEENLQARIRGTLLMALSNKFDWLVLTTSNKSETAVGYSTMYGDAAGGFAVIKDVPKTMVYRLSELCNETAGSFVIPLAVLDKPPTAELRPDQRDEDTLPPYAVLDPILQGYVEHDLSIGELVAAGAEEATARRVVDLVDHAEYKRRQSPIGPRITTRGFGKDRRMPITNRFRASAAMSEQDSALSDQVFRSTTIEAADVEKH